MFTLYFVTGKLLHHEPSRMQHISFWRTSPGHNSVKTATINNQSCNLMQLNTISNLDILSALYITEKGKTKWTREYHWGCNFEMWEVFKVASTICTSLGYRWMYSMDIGVLTFWCMITGETVIFDSLAFCINLIEDVTLLWNHIKDATYSQIWLTILLDKYRIDLRHLCSILYCLSCINY